MTARSPGPRGGAPLLLAIDAGNTNVAFALFDGETMVARWRAATDIARTADEYAVWLTGLMAPRGLAPERVGGAVVAAVVPRALFEIEALCRDWFGREPAVVGKGLDPGLDIRVDRPGEVGADRLVNAVAAHARYPGWLAVVDFGTATTFDVVNANGAYEGGVIAPGVNLSLEALERAAARLPRIEVEKPPRAIGKDTVSAMQSGVYWGYVAMIEGLIARISAEVGEPVTAIATGGLAPLFADATRAIDAVAPDLTLHGLMLLGRGAAR